MSPPSNATDGRGQVKLTAANGTAADSVTVAFTTFPDKYTTTEGKQHSKTWPALALLLTDHKVGPKEGECLAAGIFSGPRSGPSIKIRSLLMLDIEQRKEIINPKTGKQLRPAGPPAPAPAQIVEQLRARGLAGQINTTHSHTEERPRSRVVIPLARPVVFTPDDPAEHEVQCNVDSRAVLLVARYLGLAAVLDGSKRGAESVFFMPRHPEGAVHFSATVTGAPLEWEPWQEEARIEYEADEARLAEARAAKPRLQTGPIARFNASVGPDLTEMMLAFGYQQSPRSKVDFRSPFQTTQSYATRIYPDGRWVSLSASDAAAGLGLESAAGGARCGDAFDLLTLFKHDNNMRAALSWLAVKETQATAGPLTYVSDFGFDVAQIPPRDWVIKGLLLRRHLSVLVAPAGTGKSLISLQLAIAMVMGQSWGDWEPARKFKVLILNTEDDRAEMYRRIFAACEQMKVERTDLNGRLLLADLPGGMVMVRRDPATREIIETGFSDRVREICLAEEIDAVVVDPLIETHNLVENEQNDLKAAAVVLRELGRTAGVATLAIHHTPKGAGDMAGNADAARGAGSLIGVARIIATLFPMTETEAGEFGVAPEERLDHMRFDGAKSNYSKLARQFWFIKREIILGNGPFGMGDEVGVLEPWEGATPEATAERKADALAGKEEELVFKFGKMLEEAGRVILEGRGNRMNPPDGYLKVRIREDLLALPKIKLGNEKEDWARECLVRRFKPEEVQHDTIKGLSMLVFKPKDFSAGKPSVEGVPVSQG
jgi:KaiC/GvpD/RAD55 family RecA-like ATPase